MRSYSRARARSTPHRSRVSGDVETAALNDPAVLDQTAFWKDQPPAAVQDIAGNKLVFIGVICRQRTDAREVIAKLFIAKEDVRGKDPKRDTRSAMHHERHDKCLEAGEVIGYDDTASHGQLIVEAMEPDAHIQAAF